MTSAVLSVTAHDAPGLVAPAVVPPLVDATSVAGLSAAEEARTLVAQANAATLASLSEDGTPWASLVAFATLEDGAPVLLVSHLAEHGRNLERDPRASLVVTATGPASDPLAVGRVTLAGRVTQPAGSEHDEARAAFLANVPAAATYSRFQDFKLRVLNVERVRWVGGYGTMDWASSDAYAAAAPDPVGDVSGAIAHLNAAHADALLQMAQVLAGYTDAGSARCTRIDRYGLELSVVTPRGGAVTRVGFASPLQAEDELRAATVALAVRARTEAIPRH